EHWYTLNSFPTASKLLSDNSSLNTAQLQSIVAGDSRVAQLQAAYPHEILLAADIAHNNTLNSYISTHAMQTVPHVPSSSITGPTFYESSAGPVPPAPAIYPSTSTVSSTQMR